MSQNDAHAWWAEVEHLREGIEERRAADPARGTTGRHATAVAAPRPHTSAVAMAVAADRRVTVTPELVVAPAAPRPRRTVQITGRGSQAPDPRPLVEIERRRPAPRVIDRAAHRPDRIALWAAVLGVVLILVAITSAHG